MSDQETTANDPKPDASLAAILEAVQNRQNEAYKAHNRLVRRLERLSEGISDLGHRMNAVDQFLHNLSAALLPVDVQLRITANTPTDGTTVFSSRMVQPQVQRQPAEYHAPPSATADDTTKNEAKVQAAAAPQPRHNPTREKPATGNASTSTKHKPT